MTQEEIIEMARQAGMDYIEYISEDSMKQVKAFANLATAKEREACAKVCDRATLRFHLLWGKFEYPEDQAMSIGASQCAAAIRERGQA